MRATTGRHQHAKEGDAVESAFNLDVDYAMLQKIYGADPEPEKRLRPVEDPQQHDGGYTRQPGAEAHFNELRRTAALERANELPSIHQIVKRIQPQAAQPCGGRGADLLRLQLRADSPYTADEPGNGGWRYGSSLGRVGHRGASSTGRIAGSVTERKAVKK